MRRMTRRPLRSRQVPPIYGYNAGWLFFESMCSYCRQIVYGPTQSLPHYRYSCTSRLLFVSASSATSVCVALYHPPHAYVKSGSDRFDPDCSKRLPGTQGTPCVLPTTAPVSYLDLHDLTALLDSSGHGDLVSLETWSRDAGAYYCNEQFYRTLHAIRAETPTVDGPSFTPVSC